MRKLIAMFAVFGLTTLVAVYVALAPLETSAPDLLQGLTGMLDGGAERISAIDGRSTAVLALIGSGIVLGLIAGFLAGDKAEKPEPDDADLSPGPVWRPDPLAQEDRIANLRRRAGVEARVHPDAEPVEPESGIAEAGTDEIAPAEAPTLPQQPVVLARKVRGAGGIWAPNPSWLGGLPRMAGAEWPRDAEGRPLPFAAQIDLAQLAHACPQSPLPREGSLAFFLGAGAVVAVPPGDHEFTQPPADLPPAYVEDGSPLPAAPSRLGRRLFPFWPVEPVALPLPEDLLDHRDGTGPEAIEEAMHTMVRDRFGEPSPVPVTGSHGALWWYGVAHLADQLHEAMDDTDRVIAMEARLEQAAQETLAELEARADALPEAVAGARRKLHDIQARRQEAEHEAAALPAMVEALDGFIANRNPWEPLTAEERDLVVDILAEIHRRHGRLVQHSLPHSLEPLQALCIRTMASGAPEAFAALPGDIRARIASECRVPAGPQHQVFGPAGFQSAQAEGLLLLQLAYDDIMEWRWQDKGVFRFRISPQDAAAGNWNRAQLSFEGG